eukprot:755326-Hanusia_phi.AAC.2
MSLNRSCSSTLNRLTRRRLTPLDADCHWDGNPAVGDSSERQLDQAVRRPTKDTDHMVQVLPKDVMLLALLRGLVGVGVVGLQNILVDSTPITATPLPPYNQTWTSRRQSPTRTTLSLPLIGPLYPSFACQAGPPSAISRTYKPLSGPGAKTMPTPHSPRGVSFSSLRNFWRRDCIAVSRIRGQLSFHLIHDTEADRPADLHLGSYPPLHYIPKRRLHSHNKLPHISLQSTSLYFCIDSHKCQSLQMMGARTFPLHLNLTHYTFTKQAMHGQVSRNSLPSFPNSPPPKFSSLSPDGSKSHGLIPAQNWARTAGPGRAGPVVRGG